MSKEQQNIQDAFARLKKTEATAETLHKPVSGGKMIEEGDHLVSISEVATAVSKDGMPQLEMEFKNEEGQFIKSRVNIMDAEEGKMHKRFIGLIASLVSDNELRFQYYKFLEDDPNNFASMKGLKLTVPVRAPDDGYGLVFEKGSYKVMKRDDKTVCDQLFGNAKEAKEFCIGNDLELTYNYVPWFQEPDPVEVNDELIREAISDTVETVEPEVVESDGGEAPSKSAQPEEAPKSTGKKALKFC